MNEIPLKDIHLPDAALWWPPAPGWWLLLIALILMVFAGRYFRYWLHHRSYRTLSLREYKAIHQSFDQAQDYKVLLAEVSSLLRRTAISYQGRQSTASLTGADWITQLNQLSGEPCFTAEQQELLISGQYRRELQYDVDALFASCERWIKALPRSRSHVSA
jgi:hypothetical protein